MYAVASDGIRVSDNLQATKNKYGSVMIRYIHRGSAYEILTDKNGVIVLPTTNIKTRKIGDVDNSISTDFFVTGKVSDVNWEKVWDPNIADGKDIGMTKTGKTSNYIIASEIFVLSGSYKIVLNKTILKITAELNIKNK